VLAKEEAKAKKKTVLPDRVNPHKKAITNGFICSRLYIKPKFDLIIFYSVLT
jgi:hypothetical protein